MTEYCTIFCTNLDYQLATEVVRLLFQPQAIEVSGHDYRWRKITIKSGKSALILDSKIQHRPDDNFSKIITRTTHYCRHIQTGNQVHKTRVLSTLQACNLLIGVTAQPGFSQEAGHYDCIFGLTRALHGLIFNGYRMIDENGHILLNLKGSSPNNFSLWSEA